MLSVDTLLPLRRIKRKLKCELIRVYQCIFGLVYHEPKTNNRFPHPLQMLSYYSAFIQESVNISYPEGRMVVITTSVINYQEGFQLEVPVTMSKVAI